MKILVTGGAGFVGSHLVDALISAGHEVRVLDCLEPQVHGEGGARPEHLHPDAELRIGNVCDRAAVAEALEGVEAVFHQAAQVGVGQSMYEMARYVQDNSVGAAVVLEEVVRRREQIRKMIVASSMSIYGEGAYRDADGGIHHPGLRSEQDLAERRWDPLGPDGAALEAIPTREDKPLRPTSVYAVTKRDHEELFLSVGAAYGVPAVALRYFNIYGPRQALSNPYTGVMAIFASQLTNANAPFVFEDGLQTRDFIHVSDIVRANLLALERDEANGGIYNVATGRPTEIRDVARVLAERLGVDIAPELVGRYRAGDIRHCFADTTRAQRDLGFESAVSLADGLGDLVEWIRTQKAEDRVASAAAELERRGLTR